MSLESGSRVEVVTLQKRSRKMHLKMDILEKPEGAMVTMTVPGHDPVQAPLRAITRFELPDSMPLGRSAVDLSFPKDAEVAVLRAVLESARPAGQVRFGEDVIAQEPWSAIDFAQQVEPGTVLTGEFYPPGVQGEGLEFTLEMERPGKAPVTAFRWPGGAGAGPEFEVDVGDEGGLVKFRLLATGAGTAGRWKGLTLSWRELPPPEVVIPESPRLVVLYVLDALRADYVSAFGGARWPTPVLDQIAAEGVVLASHMSNAPNTKPSLKNLFSGRSVLFEGHRKMPESITTLAESFYEVGFRTAAFSGTPWVASSLGTAQGFEYRPREAKYKSEPPNNNAAMVHATTLQYLDILGEDERAFLYLHTMHPHNPYNPPGSFKDEFAAGIDSEIEGTTGALLDIRKGKLETSDADRERLRALYAAGLAYNDQELGGFLEDLRTRFEPGEVLVVFTSDHGEELFDHGGVLHGYTLYEDQLHVPLVFWWPGRLQPARVEVGTDHLDLHATLRSLVQAEMPADVEGTALWDVLTGRSDEARRVRFAAASSVKGGIFMARSQRYKLIWAPRTGRRWGMGDGPGRSYESELVFDLEEDPGERVNLAGEPNLEVTWLRSRMMAWIERGKLMDTGAGDQEQMSDETRAELRALGYLD